MVTVAVKVSGATFIASTGYSGLAVGGFISGAVATIAACGALWVTLRAAKRTREREYADEIKAAHAEGVKETEQRLKPEIARLLDDRNQWRRQATRRGGGDE